MDFISRKFSRRNNIVFSKLEDVYTDALSAMEVLWTAFSDESGFSGVAATLKLGPEGGLLMCRWGWRELKTERWENTKGFGLVGVKRIGKGAAENKRQKLKWDQITEILNVRSTSLVFICRSLIKFLMHSSNVIIM